MNETYNLELQFENEEGKSRKITIRRPLIDLTEVEVYQRWKPLWTVTSLMMTAWIVMQQ